MDYSIREPYRTLKNMLGCAHAYEACRALPNLKKFMYVGTDEVYGECDHPMKEDENPSSWESVLLLKSVWFAYAYRL